MRPETKEKLFNSEGAKDGGEPKVFSSFEKRTLTISVESKHNSSLTDKIRAFIDGFKKDEGNEKHPELIDKIYKLPNPEE